MMKRIFACLLLAMSIAMPHMTLAEVAPARAKNDNRIRFVNYDPYNVTKIIGSIRSSVQVEFAEEEEIAHVAIGNAVAWEVAPAGNIIFLKPREVQPVTNLQVVTTRRDGSKRSYQFELRVREGDVTSGNDTYFFVKYQYPADEAARRKAQAELRKNRQQAAWADEVLDTHENFGPRNWAYSAQGTAAIEPISVYDNGKTTTFTFAGNQEIPAIYLVGTDGKESLVPKTTKGRNLFCVVGKMSCASLMNAIIRKASTPKPEQHRLPSREKLLHRNRHCIEENTL